MSDCHHTHDEHKVKDELQIEGTVSIAFEAHAHLEASAVSCQLAFCDGAHIALQELTETLMVFAKELEGKGVFIGHIKGAIVGDDGAAAGFSITDTSKQPMFYGNQSTELNSHTQVQVVAIIVGITPHDALHLLKHVFASTFVR